MRFIAKISILLINLFWICVATAEPEKMIFAIDLIRHGDRTPLAFLPTAPFPTTQSAGELTIEGMQQEHQLGIELRKRYVEINHLLPKYFDEETVLVRSTDFNRTLMSAESLLLGLYPPGKGSLFPRAYTGLPEYQPIPIHTLPKKEDTLLVPSYDRDQGANLLKKYVYTRSDWQQKVKEAQPHFTRWSKLTGIPITNLNELGILADTLYIYQLHHVPLPEGLTTTEAEQIIQLGKWQFVTQYKPRQVGDTLDKELLKTIANYMRQASEQKTKLKFVLFSAHDSTILETLSALHAPLDTPPRYASDLNFRLLETTPGKYIVKIFFNDQPVIMPDCNNLPVCTLEQFEALVKK